MDTDTYSFVVRIWREAIDSEGDFATWRGSIDDVSSGERSYFTDLGNIPPFIREQLGGRSDDAPSRRERGGDPDQP